VSVREIRFDEFLNAKRDAARTDLRGKVVFVGRLERDEIGEYDHYRTVMSEGARGDTSGVELSAVALLNLLEDSTIQRADPHYEVALLFLFGLGVTVAVRGLPLRWGVLCAGLVSAAYVAVATWRFSQNGIWLPLAVPLGACVPLALAHAAAMQLVDARRQNTAASELLRQFLPSHVVTQMVENAGRLDASSESIHGVCVATDARHFTTLAEAMPSDQLVKFMNGYFDALFQPVANHGGMVSDTAGDSMVAVFPARSLESDVRQMQACLACVEILQRTDSFNTTSRHGELVTRIGVNFGSFTLANMGAVNHFEYHAVGDRVNTASRLQELNKQLGVNRRPYGAKALSA
jgi:adenylate cyclase